MYHRDCCRHLRHRELNVIEELEEIFGKDIDDIVREVTDDKGLLKPIRKKLQIEHAPHASSRAKQLKIADKICNIRDIMKSPPKDWSLVRKVDYLDWASKVVSGCRGVNICLDKAYDNALAEGKNLQRQFHQLHPKSELNP
jgi:GTP diphosphokinase / guanosine-3',5'-bis(diphosphate) 3'-diphosphatase